MDFSVGNQTSSLPIINTILTMGRSNSRFELSFPDRSPMRSSTLRTNPFLSLLTIILAIGQWPSFFFCLPIFGILAKTAGTLSSSDTKTHWQCVGYIANVFCYIYQTWKILLVVVKLPLISWLGYSQVTRAVDLLDHWELLWSGDWNSKCLLLLSLQSTEIHHPGTLHVFSKVIPEWLLLSESVAPKIHPYDLPKEGSCAI